MKKIVEMQFGSHVYGTNTPESDLDFKAVAIPSSQDIIMQKAFRSINESTGTDNTKNTKDDIDKETFSLHYFMKLLTEGQTVCLDMLFTPTDHYTSPTDLIWFELKNNKNKLITKKMSAFAGYCQAQAAKYSLKGSHLAGYEAAMNFFAAQPIHKKIKDVDLAPLFKMVVDSEHLNGKFEPIIRLVSIPHKVTLQDEYYVQVGPKTKVPFTAACGLAHEIYKAQYDKYGARAKLAKQNEGVDWKALMHAVRVCTEAIELCETGQITFPRQDRELLLKIRKGELPYIEVAEMIENGLIELTEVKNKSSLPETPDYKWIDDFVYDTYLTEIKNDR